MLGRPPRRALSALLIACLLTASGIVPFAQTVAAEPARESGVHAQVVGNPLVPGSTAIVVGDGDCLRLRANPGLDATRVDCIPDGRTVLVLPSVVEADGYRWQLVEWRGSAGWAADVFLAPYDGPPETAACRPASTRPGLAGSVPSRGGLGLVMWGGGTTAGIETAALARDCTLTSVWATQPGGGMVGYRFGAPAFVNAPWYAAIGGQTIPAGTPMMLVCDPPGSAITTTGVAIPSPSGPAPVLVGNETPPEPDALAAVVVDEDSGAVLYEYNAYDPLPPASLTKIVTAILALEGSIVSDWVPVTDVDYRRMPGSSVMGIVPGDCFTMRDLLYGLMLPSGNDAALAIARHVAGSDEAFVAQMNALMRKMGLAARFTDPHGLGSRQHNMSAYDIAMVSRYAMTQFPLFREIVAERSWTAVGDRDLSMFNVNSFLTQFDASDGVKTGFTGEAGRTLSASATRNGHRVYAVVLNDNDRYADAGDLIDWAFRNHTWE
ncbi:MAG: serine hydrolase [Dehalococcoidia bacterium]|nr:serine hydrolase [Dehalococcoidia bacterium]